MEPMTSASKSYQSHLFPAAFESPYSLPTPIATPEQKPLTVAHKKSPLSRAMPMAITNETVAHAAK